MTVTTLGSGSSIKVPWLLYTYTPLTSNCWLLWYHYDSSSVGYHF